MLQSEKVIRVMDIILGLFLQKGLGWACSTSGDLRAGKTVRNLAFVDNFSYEGYNLLIKCG